MLGFLKNKRRATNATNIDPNSLHNIPKHIGIIMDGNGRWAKERNLPRSMGHKAGVETIREIVKACNKLGVKYLTLYAFSTENWNRPKEEVDYLMKLLVEYLRGEFEELNANNVVINSIGNIEELPKACYDELLQAYEKTKNNTGLILNLALNYGGRKEIIDAIKKINYDIKENKLKIEDVNEEIFSEYLYTKGIPDPDLIIRPSGEMRLSNFLLYQCAYSEFIYFNIKWPDFNKEDLYRAVYEYEHRDRRFGKVKGGNGK